MNEAARSLVVALFALAPAMSGTGCATPLEVSAQLQNAASSDAFPEVNACWDSTYEAMALSGAFDVVVDFRVTGGGRVSDALVAEVIDPSTGAPSSRPEAEDLSRCIEAAMNGTDLRAAGFSVGRPAEVTGYRFAFRDDNGEVGLRVDGKRVLLGPRRDRCRGLYSYDPPREAPELDQALGETLALADGADGPDHKARGLQQAYDLSLELSARLQLELDRDDLAPESREKIRTEIGRVKRTTEEVGAKIGCK